MSTEIDVLLEQTLPVRGSIKPPTREPASAVFRKWAKSQVSAYRLGLVIGYLATIYFGAAAFVAGIPAFTTTGSGNITPYWSSLVCVGGFIAAIGAIKAGGEPVTLTVLRFGRIEMVGAILLFLTLGTYAAVLLVIGYGYGDTSRAAIGAGFVALGVHPAVRMIWLIFRPRLNPKPPTGSIDIPAHSSLEAPSHGGK